METPLALPTPGADELAHVARVRAHLLAALQAAGKPWPFSVFMSETLYAPGLGYYAAGARKFGPAGDFVTAPELSPVFGGCLARQLAEIFGTLRRQSAAIPVTLVEYGAGSGALAVHLLSALATHEALPEVYAIVEVSPDLRERQAAAIAARLPPELARRVVWWPGHAPAPWRGAIVANEVLDALPVERLRVGEAGLEQCFVAAIDGALVLEWAAALPAVQSAALDVHPAALDWPRGTQFELCLPLAGWIGDALAHLQAGVALYIDYGLPRAPLAGPQRPAGTFSAFFRHRQHDDALLHPGLQDLTAWVDFTAVAEAGLVAGAAVAGFTSQAQFLVNSGLEAVHAAALQALAVLPPAEQERQRWRLAQGVQQLVMPQEMGERFRVIALAKGYDEPLVGFARRDLTATL